MITEKQIQKLELSDLVKVLEQIEEVIGIMLENSNEDIINKVCDVVEVMKSIADDNWMYIRN